MNSNTNQSLCQCVECGQVYLAGEPAADRLPKNCPHECGAEVVEVKMLAEVGDVTIQSGGWKEVLSENVPVGALQAAARTKGIVENDLGIGHGRIRFFQYDPAVKWNPIDPDLAFAILNCPPFDPGMCGKAIHPSSIREYGCAVIWIRADLPVGGMVHVVAHELRHVWQDLTWGESDRDHDREMDANVYAVRDAPLPNDLAEALRQYWIEVQRDTKKEG